MADKPAQYPDWAEDTVTDPVSGNLNKVEPPAARKLSGWNRREIPPRQWFNWNNNLINKWIKWYDQESDRNTADISDLTDDVATLQGEVAAIQSGVSETRVELTGDFSTGAQEVVCVKSGNVVTIASVGTLSHSSSSAPISGSDIPALFRPDNTIEVDVYSRTDGAQVRVGSSGFIQVVYDTYRTDCVDPFSISYILVDNVV